MNTEPRISAGAGAPPLGGTAVGTAFGPVPFAVPAGSRWGSSCSDPDAAADIGYDRLVAQGMHLAGPAYGLLLDAWGEEFPAQGTLTLKFVDMVTEDVTVDASVEDGDASITFTTWDRTVVVGNASLMAVDA